MRSKIENEGIEIEKVWKEIKGNMEKRYVRCLLFHFDSKTYLLDSVNKTLNVINKEKLDKEVFVLNPEESQYLYFGG